MMSLKEKFYRRFNNKFSLTDALFKETLKYFSYNSLNTFLVILLRIIELPVFIYLVGYEKFNEFTILYSIPFILLIFDFGLIAFCERQIRLISDNNTIKFIYSNLVVFIFILISSYLSIIAILFINNLLDTIFAIVLSFGLFKNLPGIFLLLDYMQNKSFNKIKFMILIKIFYFFSTITLLLFMNNFKYIFLTLFFLSILILLIMYHAYRKKIKIFFNLKKIDLIKFFRQYLVKSSISYLSIFSSIFEYQGIRTLVAVKFDSITLINIYAILTVINLPKRISELISNSLYPLFGSLFRMKSEKINNFFLISCLANLFTSTVFVTILFFIVDEIFLIWLNQNIIFSNNFLIVFLLSTILYSVNISFHHYLTSLNKIINTNLVYSIGTLFLIFIIYLSLYNDDIELIAYGFFTKEIICIAIYLYLSSKMNAFSTF